MANKTSLTTTDQTAAPVIARQIEATDGEIDRLVYELYATSDEEIAM